MGAKNYPVSATVSDEAFAFLSRLSKAELIDLYCQAFATGRGEADSPPPMDEIRDDVKLMLDLRRNA
jgi:hypothetical protein